MKNSILQAGENSCSSCGVCALICPHNAISIELNKNGFYRPVVDDTCTNCGLCQKVCYKYLEEPEIFTDYFRHKQVYGAWSKDDKVVSSATSGGIGHEILARCLNSGYKVCGVVFDTATDMCKHIIVEAEEGLEQLKKSKYLQSFTPEAFQFLKGNGKFAVVGTPCQIYGLRKLIQQWKREDDFILIDFFCHGTPSNLVWKKYKDFIMHRHQMKDFASVAFRSKEKSTWHKNAMKISDIDGQIYLNTNAFFDDKFFNLFLSDSCLNDSCNKCLLRLDYCESDIRIADFWGDKYKDNDSGVSLVTINSIRGEKLWTNLQDRVVSEKCTYEEFHNSQPRRLSEPHPKRDLVLRALQSELNIEKIYNRYLKQSFLSKLTRRITRKLKNIL